MQVRYSAHDIAKAETRYWELLRKKEMGIVLTLREKYEIVKIREMMDENFAVNMKR